MSNPNALFLLADHVKLSLLERKRAQSLNLGADSLDGQISKSLDQFRDGLEGLEREQQRLEEAGEEDKALGIADSVPALKKQLDDLTAQFHGFSSPGAAAALARPNDPSLAGDFEHAASRPTAGPRKPSLRNATSPNPAKSVRFSDSPAGHGADADADANRAALFNAPYRDDPDGPQGYRDRAENGGADGETETGPGPGPGPAMDNRQLHAYHSRIMEEQDAQLDALGASISRQRELSMRIGDELDEHVAMLDEADGLVDRHAGRLDRARRHMGRISRAAGENKQMVAIVLLIVILVLLIAVLK